MNAKTFLTIIFAMTVVSCSSRNPTVPTRAASPAAIPTATPIPLPTLPPTLTPIPTSIEAQITPTTLYVPVELSPADSDVYQRALNDIPIYRQGDIQITVQDGLGNPLPGYQVRYRQTSHDFMFGGISDNFHTGKLRQAGMNTWSVYLAWNWIQREYGTFDLDFTNYWLGIDELKTGGMTVRANALYEVNADSMPPFYKDVPYDEFLKRLYEHEAATVKRFAPSIDYWEAVLEPNFGNHNPLNLTKDEYYQAIATSIQAIRDNDPTATVEINFSYPCGGIDWLDNFQILQEMLDRSLDFDVLGLQFYYNGYVGAGNYPMPGMSFEEMSACYDRYEEMLAPYGKRIVGSEFTVPSLAPEGQTGYWGVPWSEDTQAQYLTTAYTVFFSKPSNLGLIWWDTVEPWHFMYNGGLIKDDGTPKKSYYALQSLIEGWTTKGEGVTGENGETTFRGFGGDYEVEIVNPATGETMVAQVHVTEQTSTKETIAFVPSSLLLEKKASLETLVSYWEAKPEPGFLQKGNNYLALIDHHLASSEWDLANQTLDSALNDLAIQTEVSVPIDQLVPIGYLYGFVMNNESAVMWGSTTLHLLYDFPAGSVTVEIKAHAKMEQAEAPIMVSGVGANYSQVWKVENDQPEVYSYTVTTTGDEQDFTIRFPYDGRIYERIAAQNGNDGELQLYIDEVTLIIRTTEVP